MTSISKADIPVKMNDRVIGRAIVEDGGKIEIKIHGNDLGRDLLNMIRTGYCEGLSINPIVVPAEAAMLEHPRIRPPQNLFGFTA